MPPLPETPRKRIRLRSDERCSPVYTLKPPPCLSWADSVFQLSDTIRDAFNDFTKKTRMSDADKAAPEMLLNPYGNLRLTLTDLMEKVDNSCHRIVTHYPDHAHPLALHDKQTQMDFLAPVISPPQQTYASVAVSHTPLQEQTLRDESAGPIDVQALDRAVKGEQLDQAMASEEEDDTNRDERTSNRRKAPSSSFTGEELRRRKECLRNWRINKFKEESLTCYVALADVATIQALDATARSRQVVELAPLE
ncbi:hypothetical protein RSOL_376720, partial [Rhizoctonia solani AG-3 Rhs1AP]